MKSMPRMAAVGRYRKSVVQFGGLNRTQGCAEGEFTDMENLACYHYPVMGTRKGRICEKQVENAQDLFEWDGHRILAADNVLWYDDTMVCNVTPGQKQFAVVNTKLVVWPDAIEVDLTNGSYETMSARVETAAGTAVLSGDTLTAATVPVIREGVALQPSVSGSVLEWCPLVYTYGTDRSAIGWTAEGGWTLPEPTTKGVTWAGEGSNSGGVKYPQSAAGDIIIPNISGAISGLNAFSAVTGSWTSGNGLTLPDTSRYNTDGYYCVIRRYEGEISIYAGSKSWLVADVYKVGVENLLFSARFDVGDRVTISGSLGGINDREKIRITAIDDTKNQITLESAAFTECFGTLTLTSDISISNWAAVRIPTDTSTYLDANLGTVQLKAGDIVRASASQNGTLTVIRDGAVVASGTYGTQLSGYSGKRLGQLTAYTGEITSLVIERDIPPMDFICARDNRLYGVSNSTASRIRNSETGEFETFTSRCVYVSALGLPHRFWDFDGTDTDSYQVAIASNGDFTGVCAYGGYTLLWKEDLLYKLYGDYPSNFGLYEYNVEGVQAGSHRSLRIINEVLYYKGRDGVYAYSGSTPTLISYPLAYRRYTDAVAGADGVHYHISMRGEDGEYELLIYDTVHQLWMREDAVQALAFALIGGTLYALTDSGLWALETDEMVIDGEYVRAEPPSWRAEFPAITEGSFDHRDYKRLLLDMELRGRASADGTVTCPAITIETAADGGAYRVHERISGQGRWVKEIPLPLMRVNRVTVRLSGQGECLLHGFAREYVEGSETH